jgi:hypothetical protein
MKNKHITLAGLATVALLGASGAIAQSAQSMSAQQFDRMYAAMDTNSDGRISRAEYSAYHAARFDTWDTTRSGMMNRDQMKRQDILREMAKTDSNPQGNSSLPGSIQKK